MKVNLERDELNLLRQIAHVARLYLNNNEEESARYLRQHGWVIADTSWGIPKWRPRDNPQEDLRTTGNAINRVLRDLLKT